LDVDYNKSIAIEKEVDWLEQVRYMISDAANIVAVESHVLRYWEDELELTVPRNELGHRYYTQENVDQFLRIKQLKEEGYQLKAIKILLHQEKQGDLQDLHNAAPPAAETPVTKPEIVVAPPQMTPQERMEQFQELMTQIVRNAMQDNNRELSQEVGTQVGERVLKEMNYLMRTQDEQEEERYRKLDEAIRSSYRQKKQRPHRKQKAKGGIKTAPGLE
jgi:DNA-binding transcriptional MerR regulator